MKWLDNLLEKLGFRNLLVCAGVIAAGVALFFSLVSTGRFGAGTGGAACGFAILAGLCMVAAAIVHAIDLTGGHGPPAE